MNLTLPDGQGEHSLPFKRPELACRRIRARAIKRNRVDLFCGSGETADAYGQLSGHAGGGLPAAAP